MYSTQERTSQGVTEQAAELYVATFAGRDDAYSVWTGEQWRAIRKPLTAQVVLEAFSTKIPVSAYVLGPDSYSHLAVLDIDRDDGFELGQRVVEKIGKLGGLGYLEKSRRGCHFWVVLDSRRPAILIRRALKQLVIESGLPADPKIELRPGSDHLSDEESLGHCIRMPTMPHQKTGIRYVLVSSDGEKLSGKLTEMMPAIGYCNTNVFDDLAERAPAPRIRPDRALRFPYGDPVVDDDSASAILRDLWGAANAYPGKLIRCPAHPDSRPSLSILKDDQRAICYAAGSGCVLHNDGKGRGTHELRALAAQRGGPS